MEHVSAYSKVGENRYREEYGLYYEDFVEGTIFEHRPGRTVTEMDNTWQSLLCMNPHPLHIDAAFAAQTEWKKPLVSSLVTLSIVAGMSVNSTSAKGLANLGWDNIRMTAPVFAGDTLYAESTILGKRVSKSRPNQGIVSVETRGLNQDGVVVITYQRKFLVPFKGHGPHVNY